jgi:hypothetical protein
VPLFILLAPLLALAGSVAALLVAPFAALVKALRRRG